MPQQRNWVAGAAILGVMIANPLAREAFFYGDRPELFWLLLVEHIILLPLLTNVGMGLLSKQSRGVSFGLSSLVIGLGMTAISLETFMGISSTGMGSIIYLIFPIADLAYAGIGLVTLPFTLLVNMTSRKSPPPDANKQTGSEERNKED